MDTYVEQSGRREDQPLPISWDQTNKVFSLLLQGFSRTKDTDQLEIKWSPRVTYVVRIRRVGDREWSYGFETPLTGCGFSGLTPNTEYEFDVRTKNLQGEESSPTCIRARTGPDGSLSQNGVPG